MQEQWLRADLAAHPTTCTLAYWHHPRYSSGHDGSNAFMQPLWQALDDAGAEIVLSGHSHDYERFAPLDPSGDLAPDDDGIRQFVVGTGGAFFTGGLDTLIPNSELAQNDTFGVLFLTLHDTSYEWRFMSEMGGTFTDTGTTLCRNPSPPPPPPPPASSSSPPPPPPPDPPAEAPPLEPNPPPGPAVSPAADPTAPVVSRLRLHGTTFRYRVSEDALVTFRIRRCQVAARGRRGSRTCSPAHW